MNIIENVTIYECEWCGKKMLRKSSMTRHEKFCTRNPENVSMCRKCENMNVYLEKLPEDSDYLTDSEIRVFRCMVTGKRLCSPKFAKRYPEISKMLVSHRLLDAKMPTEAEGCEHFYQLITPAKSEDKDLPV